MPKSSPSASVRRRSAKAAGSGDGDKAIAKTIDIRIQTTADLAGAKAVDQALAKIIQASKQSGGGAALADAAKLATATAQAATAQQKLATETQRTSVVTNQAAVSAQRLATEEQRTATATAQAAAAQTRAETAALRLAQAQEKAATASSGGRTALAGLSREALGTATAMLGVGSALAAIGKGVELAQLGAQAGQTRQRFDGLAASAGTTGQALLGAMRAASAGTISDLNLELAANRAQLLGVADSAKEFSTLMEIARARAQDMGISTTQAFNDLITGLGRGSAPILDNLGITVSVTEANKVYAAQLNKNVSALTEAEQKQALINAVLTQGKASLEAAGGAAETSASKFERLGASTDNAKVAVGGLLAKLLEFPAEITTKVLIEVSSGLNQLAESDDKLKQVAATALDTASSFDAYAQKIDFVNEQLSPLGAQLGTLTESQFNYAKALVASGSSASQATDQAFRYGAVIQAAQKATTDFSASSDVLRDQLVALSSTSPGSTAAVDNLSSALLVGNISADTFNSAIVLLAAQQEHAAEIASYDALEQARLGMAQSTTAGTARDLAAATTVSTGALIANAEQSLTAAIQTEQLSQFQTTLAGLGGQVAAGLMTASNAAAILAAQYNLTAIQAANLIAMQARLANVQAAAATGLNKYTSSVQNIITGGRSAAAIQDSTKKADAVIANVRRERDAQLQADLAVARAKGNTKTQIDLLRGSQQGLTKDSAEYKQIEASIISLQKSGAGGGRGGAGAVDKAAKAAEATATRLGDIARQGGNKLADIEESTQAKLAAIDAKYAEQRAQAFQDLNDDIARMSAGTAFDQQLNDFEQFGKDLSDEQKAAFAERERAEVRYNERVRQYQDAARQEATTGDAELAAAKLKIRTDEAKRQMEIEQRAAQANIDTGGKQKAAVAREAAESSAAAKAAADTDIAIAEAKAAERAGAQQAEKDAVIASAQEQAEKVISAAEEQAAKVKGASESQKSAVISALRAQADAAAAWASAIASSARTAQNAMAGVTGPPAPASGEDESGGAPAASTSGGGGGNGQGLLGGGGGRRNVAGGGGSDILSTLQMVVAYLQSILPLIKHQNALIKEVRTYQHTMQETIKIFADISALHKSLAQPLPPLQAGIFDQLAGEIDQMMRVLASRIDPQLAKMTKFFEHILNADRAAVAVFTEILNLRQALAAPSKPILLARIQELAAEAVAIVTLLRGQIITANQKQTDELKRYADLVSASVQALQDVAELRKGLDGPIPPLQMSAITQLASEAKALATLMQQQLIPLAEKDAALFSAYETAVSASVNTLKSIADLRTIEIRPQISQMALKELASESQVIAAILQNYLIPFTEEQDALFSAYADVVGNSVSVLQSIADLRQIDLATPINFAAIYDLARESAIIARILESYLIPYTEQQAGLFSQYADAVGAAVSVVSDVAQLRTDAADLAPPIPIERLRNLAGEARRIATIVAGLLVPTSEDAAAGLSRYAESVGDAVTIIGDVAQLRTDAKDLAGPLPVAAITGLADEARRIATIVAARLVPASEAQADSMGRYGDAVGATVGVVRDVIGLRKDALDLAPPLSAAQITRLADDARRIAQIVMARMVPASEEQAAAAQRFADTEGAAISALSSVLDLPAKMFADYRSPSNAQIDRVVADANRIVQRVDVAARAYSTDGLDAAKRFSEAVGGTFAAFKDGLLFFEALNSGDFRLDLKNLIAFERAMGQTIATAGRLGGMAATIPAGNIAALQGVTAALTASYESMIRLSAVPFGNLPQLAAGVGGAVGGGGQNITVNIYNPPAGLNVPALIGQVKQAVVQSIAGKH